LRWPHHSPILTLIWRRTQVLIASGASADVTGMATGGFGYEYQGHSLATTSTGNVFVWGWNAFGQLGLGTIDHGTATPTR
jgi:alpha-tubulin suppressor-like RCC1 family protein